MRATAFVLCRRTALLIAASKVSLGPSSSPALLVCGFSVAAAASFAGAAAPVHATAGRALSSSTALNAEQQQQQQQQKRKKKAKAGNTKQRTMPRRAGNNNNAAAAPPPPPPEVVPHAAASLVPAWMNRERIKVLTSDASAEPLLPATAKEEEEEEECCCILYWMHRDVRTADNWALLFAGHLARERGVPLRVCYALPPPPPPTPATEPKGDEDVDDDDGHPLPPLVTDLRMTERHGQFLLGGLRAVAEELSDVGVSLDVLRPPSDAEVGRSVVDLALGRGRGRSRSQPRALAVVCDFSPLRRPRAWTEEQAAPLFDGAAADASANANAEGGGEGGTVPLYQVDAHNIVPVWTASPKREVGARTLRPKINKLLPEFMTHFPEFEGNAHLEETEKKPASAEEVEEAAIDWDRCEEYLDLDGSVPSCDWAVPGARAALARFDAFCGEGTPAAPGGLKKFADLRNDPNYDGVCSNLSPWINAGHVSFQRLALTVRGLKRHSEGVAAFIEEGVVRRELSDNYVYYTPGNYDTLTAAAGWARASLELHAADVREYVYTAEEFEAGKTHDDLWNAAQMQLTAEGGMHGFLRMYWAKKILEWTPSPLVALRTAQYFNDRFALDGNDPNGYVGVGWSIMGVHDMGWKERDVFGKIRFMNYAGCKRKFKVDNFVAKYPGAKANALAAAKKHGSEKPEAAKSKQKKTVKVASASSSSSSSSSGTSASKRKKAVGPKKGGAGGGPKKKRKA